LGQYEVQELIGQGAMGVVYRAYHVPLARTGAVKVMHGISPDPDSIARFRREAQAIAQMRHPNILNVFDFGEFQGTPYMIVEYVPGGSLAAQMKKGPLETDAALEYLDGIASGLDYAHSLGIVHRDVKPANVLVARDGTPIIADFGLVKLLQSTSLNSMTGATTGTPAYMAPEQVTGSKVGPAADRYSLATMAYEMLTGAFPFEDDSVLEMMYAHVHREPTPPSSHRPELGSRVDAVLQRGLAKDPDARWESCAALVAGLRSALEAGPGPAIERTVVMAPPVAAAPIARPKAAPADATAMMPLPAPAKSRRRLYSILAAVVLLLLVISSIGLIIAAGTPTLSLSSTTVSPGDTLVVTASHVPKNQLGEIQILSRLTTYAFRADGNGNVSREILVPNDTVIGDHLVKICWNGTCHAQATLHVVPFGAVVITSPTPGVTPGSSPTPVTSHSPSPTSGTGGTGTKTSPTPTPTAYVRLTSVSATLNTSVTFHYFYGGSTSIQLCQDGKCYSPLTNPIAVTPGSSTTVTFKTPVGIKPTNSSLNIGDAYVRTGCCGISNLVVVGA
jgi:protein kinase-like protein